MRTIFGSLRGDGPKPLLIARRPLGAEEASMNIGDVMDQIYLTGVERHFDKDDVIVTKTDKGGKITYGNDIFLRISSLTEETAIGKPHNLIRHPDMPAVLFRVMWQVLQGGDEIFAYVLNRATTGDHYWVFAHVTPTFDANGEQLGYHSNRRVPDQDVIVNTIQPLYRSLIEVERAASSKSAGITASQKVLEDILAKKGLDYERFIFSLQA